MADTQSTVTDEGYTPEPIPDNIADTALDGFNPADESTDSEQVEDQPDETEQDQTTEDPADEADEETDDSGTPDEQQEAETEDDGQQQEQPTDQQEAAREAYKQREQKRQQRDYVQEQRRNIRDYELELQQKIRNNELSELEQLREEQKVLNAKLYTDSVERNRSSVIAEGQRALTDIPLFKENTPQSQEVFNQSLQAFRQAYGVYDEQTGELVATEDRYGNPVSLYDYLQQQAAIVESARVDAQRVAQRNEIKMRSKAVNPSNPGKVTAPKGSDDWEADFLDKFGDTPLN